MYSFSPTDEQKMLIDAVGRFAADDLRQAARDADEEGVLSLDLIEKGWELGYLQASVPEEYGGFGERSVLTGVLAAEEMAYGDLAGGMAVMLPGLFVVPILVGGTEEQKKAFIPPVIDAEWKPYTAASMEARFDFDPNTMETKAVPDGDAYVINGEKTYVPYAKNAEGMIVFADLEGTVQGFVVEKGTQGVEVGERMQLLGLNALPLYPVSFKDVHVPAGNRIGGTSGFDYGNVLASGRVAMAAMAIGISRAAFEYSRDYAKERDVFGVKVAQKQAIAFMIAEMATEIEAIRLLVWEAAWMIDNNKPDAARQAYLALTGAVDMAMMVTDRAVQILGGHGYIREHPVEMWMRNGRGFANFSGLAIV